MSAGTDRRGRAKLAQALASALQGEHYDVVVAASGEDGFFRANAEACDLVVLDVMLPGRSGLESSFDKLRRFTADASHELRTPLAVIRGIGEAGLVVTRTPAEYKEAIGGMLEEIDRLTTLVDTLLRLSHGDAGSVHLSRESLDLGQLTRDVAASLAVLAEERRQQVSIQAAEGVSVHADRLVLREAITNVIDNAIKYSPAGASIVASIRAVDDHAVVEVTDHGPGIAAEHRERIFDRFFSAPFCPRPSRRFARRPAPDRPA